jgi:hypothetical protein
MVAHSGRHAQQARRKARVVADIVFVCVRQDLECAEALANAFENVGFSIEPCFSEEAMTRSGAGVILISAASARCDAFVETAQAVIESGKAVVVSLVPAKGRADKARQAFDLSEWDGDPDDGALAPIICAIDDLVLAADAACALEVDLPYAPAAARSTASPNIEIQQAAPPILAKAPRRYRSVGERAASTFSPRAMLGAGLCLLFAGAGVFGVAVSRAPHQDVAQTAGLASGAPVVALNSAIATDLSPERVAYRPESEVTPVFSNAVAPSDLPRLQRPRPRHYVQAHVSRPAPLIVDPDAPA